MMLREPMRGTDGPAKVGGDSRRVTAKVWKGKPVELLPITDEKSKDYFTKEALEGALDETSRPTSRGKYAHVPYGSEDLIRDKRAEVELEDRSS